jgi:hypothetical protein
LFHDAQSWRLRDFPWRAAFRIEPEDSYLTANTVEYPVARLIQSMTLPDEQILALTSVARAYTDRTVLEFWHSSQADLLVDWLRANAFYNGAPLYDVKADWPPRLLRAVRFRLNKPDRGEWDILEVRLYSGEDRISSSPQWTLSGWPNVWELTAAFDNNLGTHWRSWSPMRPGMYAQADLDRPQRLSGATLISHSPVYGVPMEVYGMDTNGRWHSFGMGRPVRRVQGDFRRPAIRAIKREGFHYLLAPSGNDGLAALNRAFVGHEEEWGLAKVGEAGRSNLYRIR